MPTLTRRTTFNFPPTASSAGVGESPVNPLQLQQRSSYSGGTPSRIKLAHHLSYGPGSLPEAYEEPLEYAVRQAAAALQENGGNLPQTYVNQLSLNVPLCLASINRYLLSNGFAPYICRRRRAAGLDILDERYDAAGGTYSVVYRVHPSIAADETRIRFWGTAFAGRFQIEVLRASGWRIEYDVEPTEQPDVHREDSEDHPASPNEDNQRRRRAPRRSSLSVLAASPPLSALPARSRSPSVQGRVGEASRSSFQFPAGASNLKSPSPLLSPEEPASPTSEYFDPAKLPGPLGGTTLIIPNSNVEGGIVSVTISKNADRMRSSLDRMKHQSEALGKAARGSYDGIAAETIEELIHCSHGEGEALANLRIAREVMRQVEVGREKEKRERERQGRSPMGVMRGRFPSAPRVVVGATGQASGASGRTRAGSVTLSAQALGLGLQQE
ncbi:hypothetical protein MNV49_001511 [Pseudohyphozyma bogoriensis]|nr:hypothetical protein MNV49_001511 [Pseudohyphozyma bogoriensis]